MSSLRKAEIAGAGFAGLAAACVLAQRGWSVRVHERGEELREIGAGIFIWSNGLRALREIGVYDAATARAERIEHYELRDERGRLLQKEWMLPDDGEAGLYTILRGDLHSALAEHARALGAEILTGSYVAGASPDGTLHLTDGSRATADLIVGADGVGSRVRDSLSLAASVVDLRDGCGRHLIDRLPHDPVNVTHEQWHGGRRIGVVPVAPDKVYIYLCCPESDDVGRRKPLDYASWSASFPKFADQIARIPDDEGRWASFHDVSVKSWRAGRVALIGDACHAMSPNLGQATCVALNNAVALGQSLDAHADVEHALEVWERSERPITDITQRYSRLYGRMGTRWPAPLTDLRSAVVWGMGRSRRFQSRVNSAAHHTPRISAAA